MDRRRFLATSCAAALIPIIPAPAAVAPALPIMGGVATSSFAWGATPDEMIAALLAQMQEAAA